MYLYLIFFNEQDLASGCFRLSGQNWDRVKEVFPTYHKLNDNGVRGCIGIIKGKAHRPKQPWALSVTSVKAETHFLEIRFTCDQELEATNQVLDSSLYGHAARSDWLDERGYYPLVCMVEKVEFDRIRQQNTQIRKMSSFAEEISTYKAQNNWV